MIRKIDNALLQLPPSWMSRIVAGNRPLGTNQEIRKLLGEPIPQVADLDEVPPEVAAMFGRTGVLERIRRKLAVLSRKRGRAIVPAKNTIAAVDEEDNLYVGVEFLQACQGEEAVIAGILSHEWGHLVSDLPRGVDWSHLTWEELFALRRDEEANADAYAGRAMFRMGYAIEPVAQFFGRLEQKPARHPSPKYYATPVRIAILRQAYAAEQRVGNDARKLFPEAQFRHPSTSQLLSVG
ncbi:MAG: hypothetical protein HY543_05405 [Deltaproteobacteria bacterium]|nr:hypothetical protein [Deltaproteobacteria bacterium]